MTPPLRPATEADVPALQAVFRAAVEAAGPTFYTPEQVRVWADAAKASARFRRLVTEAHTLVAEDASGLTGFATLGAGGYVDMLYVRPDRMRQGLAGRLLAALIEQADRAGEPRMHTVASRFSRPVFERAGFVLEATEAIERGGVSFHRFLMTRTQTPTV